MSKRKCVKFPRNKKELIIVPGLTTERPRRLSDICSVLMLTPDQKLAL
jgi:hypothetical protein